MREGIGQLGEHVVRSRQRDRKASIFILYIIEHGCSSLECPMRDTLVSYPVMRFNLKHPVPIISRWQLVASNLDRLWIFKISCCYCSLVPNAVYETIFQPSSLSALIEVHAITTGVRVFLHLEIIRRQPEWLQYTISQLLQLAHHVSHLLVLGRSDARR